MAKKYLNYNTAQHGGSFEIKVDVDGTYVDDRFLKLQNLSISPNKQGTWVLNTKDAGYELQHSQIRFSSEGNHGLIDYPRIHKGKKSNRTDFIFRVFNTRLHLYFINKSKELWLTVFDPEKVEFSENRMLLAREEPESQMDDEEADSLTYGISDYVRIWNPRRDFFSKQHEVAQFQADGLSFNDFPIATVTTWGSQKGYIFASSYGIEDIVYPDQGLDNNFQMVSVGFNISEKLQLRVSKGYVRAHRRNAFRKLGNQKLSGIWVSDEPKYTYDPLPRGTPKYKVSETFKY
jgi:hypothetical protein